MLVTVSFNFCMFMLPLAACRVVLSLPSLTANDTSLSGQLTLLTLNWADVQSICPLYMLRCRFG